MAFALELAEAGVSMARPPARQQPWRLVSPRLAVVLAAFLCLPVTSAWAAAIDPIGFSPDPTEGESLTVTVSGSTETTRTLYVLGHEGTAACGATPSAEYAGPGDYIGTFGGDSVPTGSFSKNFSFTPDDAATIRICAYVATSTSATPAATQTSTVTVRLPTASINALSFSADPVEDQALSTTVTGTTEASRTLYVLRHTGTSACGATASTEYAGPGAYLGTFGGDSVPAGSFSKTFSFTPTDAGTYRICAYVGRTTSAAPLAAQTDTVAVRLPTASINALAFSADPAEDQALSTTVTGTTEASRTLYVLRHTGTSACGTTASAEYAGPGAYLGTFGGDSVPAGSFSKTFSFTPTDAGTYRICAYVGRTTSAASLAHQTDTVTVRLPAASVSLSSGTAVRDAPVNITAAGATEAARTLYVLRHGGATGCAGTAASEYAGAGTYVGTFGGDSIPAGGFSKTSTFTPTEAGVYRICGYVGEGSSSVLAASVLDVTVRRPAASVTIATDTPPYLKGQSVTLQIAGEAERDGLFGAIAVDGDSPCPPSLVPAKQRIAIKAGLFQRSLPVEYSAASAHTVCVFVYETGDPDPLTIMRRVITKQPLAVPQGATASATADRKPTFSWSSAPTGRDTLQLLQDGEVVLRITESGSTRGARSLGRRVVGRIAASSSVGTIKRQPDGTSVVQINRPMPPGNYTWRVARKRDAGEIQYSAELPLHVPGPPLRNLAVRTSSHRGSTWENPGFTLLKIRTSPWARIEMSLVRSGRKQVYWFSWGDRVSGRQRIDWTCKAKGDPRYRYTITARDDRGKVMTKTGSFSVASDAWCKATHTSELKAKARRRAAMIQRVKARLRAEAIREAARVRAEAQEEAAAHARLVARYKNNCRAAGGTPVVLQFSDGSRWACRGPFGGFIFIPYS
jgi:hypothetical protein